jgi:HJR/Mrr/RecB family endonuclease
MFLDLVKAESQKPGTECRVATILRALDKAERAELVEALQSSFAAAAIARALTKMGHDCGPTTITRHRRGDCVCGKAS